MDNSPRFSDVSSFAYSDELNFPPSSSLKNARPSVPNSEVTSRPVTRRNQPIVSRAAAVVQAAEPSRGGSGASWQKSLRSSKSFAETPTRNGSLSRTLTSRALDLSSSLSSSVSIADSTISRRTKASTTSSKAVFERNSTTRTSRISELAHLQEQLEVKSRLLSAMEQQVLDAVQQIEDLQKEREVVKYEKDLLAEECDQLRTENAGLTGQMKHLKEARTKLHRRCQEAEEGMSELKKQLDDMKANSDVACVSADICKAALAQSLSEALAIHFRMLEAQSLLQNCQSELEMHRRHVRQLSDMLEQMHCQLSGALDQLEQATNSERQLKAQLATLQKEVNTALDRLSESQQQHSALEAQELELLSQLEHLMQGYPASTANITAPAHTARVVTNSHDHSHHQAKVIDDTSLVRVASAEGSEDLPAARDQDAHGIRQEVVDHHYDNMPEAGMSQTRLQEWLKSAIQQGEAAGHLGASSHSSLCSDTPNTVKLCPPDFVLQWADGKRLDAGSHLTNRSFAGSAHKLRSSVQSAGQLHAGKEAADPELLNASGTTHGMTGQYTNGDSHVPADGTVQVDGVPESGLRGHLTISAELLRSLMPYMSHADKQMYCSMGLDSTTAMSHECTPTNGADPISEQMVALMRQHSSLSDAGVGAVGHVTSDEHMVQYSVQDKQDLEAVLHGMLELQSCCRYVLNSSAFTDLSVQASETAQLQAQSAQVAQSAQQAQSAQAQSARHVKQQKHEDVVPQESVLGVTEGWNDTVEAVDDVLFRPAVDGVSEEVLGVCEEVDEKTAARALWVAKEKLEGIITQLSESIAVVVQQLVLVDGAAAGQLLTRPAVSTALPDAPDAEMASVAQCASEGVARDVCSAGVDVGDVCDADGDVCDADGEASSSSSSAIAVGKRRWVVADPETFLPDGLDDLVFMDRITGVTDAVSGTVPFEEHWEVDGAALSPADAGEASSSCTSVSESHPEVLKWRQQLREMQLQYDEVLAVLASHGEDYEAVRAQRLQWVREVLRAVSERRYEKGMAVQPPCVEALGEVNKLLERKENQLDEAVKRLGEVERQFKAAEQQLFEREKIHHAEVTSILEEAAKRLSEAERRFLDAEQQLFEREQYHQEEVDDIMDAAARQLGEAEMRFQEAEQRLCRKDETYHMEVSDLKVQLEERDRKLQEHEVKLAALTEQLLQREKQQAEAAQQLMEREAQLIHALAKFERVELQLHLEGRCLPGQLPGSYHPASNQLLQHPKRLLLSSPLLERQPSRPLLQHYTTASPAHLVSQYKLQTAMNRTSTAASLSACANPACTCPYCINATADHPFTARRALTSSRLDSISRSGAASTSASTVKLPAAGGIGTRSPSRFRFGRRLILTGVPISVLVVACIWVAELLRSSPKKAPIVEKQVVVAKPAPRFPWQRDS